MKYSRALPVCFLLIASWLSACAPFTRKDVNPPLTTIQHQLYGVKNWKLEGRIAVKAGLEGWNANLSWAHEDRQDRLLISGPFSQGAVSIIVQADLVYINEGNGVVSSSREPDELLKSKLGFSVPLHSLRYWVLGLPDPDVEYQTTVDTANGPNGFAQQTWKLVFENYEKLGDYFMPHKITVQGNGVRLKLVVDDWLLTK